MNAFALPGGWLVINSGLIAQAESPDEVAGVVAHEMAHVMHRHGLKRVAHSLGVVAAVQLLIGDLGGLAASASQLATLAAVNDYSRDAEREADATGVALMHQAGADPYAMAVFFERLEEKGNDIPDFLSWVSTHPSHHERIENVSELVKDLPEVDKIQWNTDWQAVQASLASPSLTHTPQTEDLDPANAGEETP